MIINSMESQQAKANDHEDVIVDEIKKCAKDLIDGDRYKSIKKIMSRYRTAPKKNGNGAVLVKYLLIDPFCEKEMLKPVSSIPFMVQTFAFTEHTKLQDIFEESIRFFGLDGNSRKIQSGGSDEVPSDDKTNEVMKMNKNNVNDENMDDIDEGVEIDKSKFQRRVTIQGDAVNEIKNITEEAQPGDKFDMNNVYNDYVLTDVNHNDLSMLFNVPVNIFFSYEEENYCILYLRKKNTQQKTL